MDRVTESPKVWFVFIAGMAAVNFAVGQLLGLVVFNAGRIALLLVGGWSLAYLTQCRLWHAALVGIVVLFVDHILLRGGSFLLDETFGTSSGDDHSLMGFIGVLISFLIGAPFAALLSFLAGLTARSWSSS